MHRPLAIRDIGRKETHDFARKNRLPLIERLELCRRIADQEDFQVLLGKLHGQEVAVKTVSYPRYEKEWLDKLTRHLFHELQIMMRIEQPHVVRGYGFLEYHPNEYAIVMEYIRGPNPRLPMEEIRAVIRATQLSRALSDVHAYGIVHRDIKPENIMQDGNLVKIIDFGIAYRHGWEDLCPGAHNKYYHAPEQSSKNEPTPRWDQYAFGRVLLNWVNPRRVESECYLDGIINEAPIGKGLKLIIRRATETDPQKRFESMDDMWHALLRYLHELSHETILRVYT